MGVFTKSSVDAESALKAIEAGRAKAAEIGIPVSIAVLDEAGDAKATLRMDGAALGSADVAHDKAYTVVFLGLGLPTEQLYEAVKQDAALLAGLTGRAGIALFGGGAPIATADGVVGAIGVSGGRESDDRQVLEAALAAIAG